MLTSKLPKLLARSLEGRETKMKPTERDALLVRLDEKTGNIEGDVKEIKETLVKQNDRIRANEKGVSRIKGILVGVGILGGGSGAVVGLLNLFI